MLDLSRRVLVHIKEMRHCRSHGLDARIIEFHANLAMKNLEQGAVPKLHDIVMGGKAFVDKPPKVFADRLGSMPVGNTEIAFGILEAFRRERTDVVQAEARKNGLRYDSRYNDLRQRDQEIAGSAKFFRMWLYDYDVENAAIGYLSKV